MLSWTCSSCLIYVLVWKKVKLQSCPKSCLKVMISCLNFRQGLITIFWKIGSVRVFICWSTWSTPRPNQRPREPPTWWTIFDWHFQCNTSFYWTQVRSLPSNFSQKYCINLFVMNSYFWQKTEDGWTYNSGRWNLHEYDLRNNLDIYSLCQIYLNILLERNCEASFIFRARWAY